MAEGAIGIPATRVVTNISVVPGAEGGPAFVVAPQNVLAQWQSLRAPIKAVAGAPKAP